MVKYGPPMNPTDILTTQETCRILNIARQTLYIWIEQGKIKPWHQLNGRSNWLFMKSDVTKAKDLRYKRLQKVG